MRDGGGDGLGTTGPNQVMRSVRWRSDGPTHADVDRGVEELVFDSPVSEREEGLGKGSMEGKHNVGLVRKALLCIRSKRCSRALCAVILPYVTLRESNAKRCLAV